MDSLPASISAKSDCEEAEKEKVMDRKMHRALVEAGYAELSDYIEKWGSDKNIETLEGYMNEGLTQHEQLFSFVKNMDGKETFFLTFPNLGCVFDRISKDDHSKLLDSIRKIRNEKNRDYTQNLVGHIKEEYDILDLEPIIRPYVMKAVNVYENNFNYLEMVEPKKNERKLFIDSIWVNFMKKHEFNPPHKHSGVFSFVIWMKIPYDLRKEISQFPNPNDRNTSCFEFMVQDILGGIKSITMPVDKSYEGVLCMFPAKLYHSVNPFFTSDDERISIAGNVSFYVGEAK